MTGSASWTRGRWVLCRVVVPCCGVEGRVDVRPEPSLTYTTKPTETEPEPATQTQTTTKQVVEYAPPVELLRKPQGHFRALCEKVRCVCVYVCMYIYVCV